MNAFGIYMIVLSVAYFLYYVANITIDWNKKDPATQVMESVDVEGVVGQDEPIEEEVVEEVEEQIQVGDGLVTGGSMDKNQDHTKYMPSSEPESKETDENTVEQEEAIKNETPIESGDPIEKKDEDVDVEEPEKVEESAHQEEQVEEVPTVEPVSSAMEAISEGDSSDDDDYDPFAYTPSVSP